MTFLSLLAALPIASGGISIFGLFSINPAIFAFLLVIVPWGLLNIIEFRRFD